VFGPDGTSIVARLVRVTGCAAICGLGAVVVHLDSHAAANGIGSGHFSLAQEIAGLALIGATLTAPFAMKARWPGIEPAICWLVVASIGVVALLIVPLQIIAVGYLAAILAATSRRSPVAPATLAVGALAGLPTGLILHEVPNLTGDIGWALLLILVPILLLTTAVAGAAAAWLTAGTPSPDEIRSARIRQGILAGMTAAAVGGLAATLFAAYFVVIMVIGPLVGVVGGALGAAMATDHPLRWRRNGLVAAGLFVSNS
jgi:hypothetical protein